MKKISMIIASMAMVLSLGAIQQPAHAVSLMSFNEMGRIFLNEDIGMVEGVSAWGCDCNGQNTGEWTQNGRDWMEVVYPANSPGISATVWYRWNGNIAEWVARRKWWRNAGGTQEYTMPPSPF